MSDPSATGQIRDPERPAAAGPATPASPGMSGGRVVMIVVGSLLTLLALCLVAIGAYGLWLDTAKRSDDYLMTSDQRFTTGAFAVATRTLEISSDVPDVFYGSDWLGDVRIRGESADPARPLFIGIGRSEDVERYLDGVGHAEVVDVEAGPFETDLEPQLRARPGGRPALAPTRARFWVARAAGPGSQELTWRVRSGRWAVVVMRPDGSRGVSADLAAGAELPALLWVSIAALALGVLGLTAGGALIFFGARQRGPAQDAPAADPTAPRPPAA